ncbi:reprolysin-like metallopeptidase [Nocardioides pyridinolyticus]
MPRPFRSLTVATAAALAATALALAGQSAEADDAVFRSVPGFAPDGSRVRVDPEQYTAVRVDTDRLRTQLAGSDVVSVPTPDGGLERFEVEPTAVMAPGLAKRHPEIRTWAGRSLDHPGTTIALDLTPMGFHASVRGAGGQGAWYVDPAYDARGTATHLSYRGASVPRPEEEFAEQQLKGVQRAIDRRARTGAARDEATVEQRVYRLALLSDPQYSTYFGAANVVAEKVTLINRVNQVYNDDLAINLQLIDGTDELSLDSEAEATGANGPCGAHPCFDVEDRAVGFPGDLDVCWPGTLVRMPTVLGQLVGASAYDVGHVVLGDNGGGIAGLGVVGGEAKAMGCTGLPEPQGDFFAIDYVAHELGHQFGGNHTFNGRRGACAGGNRAKIASVEPGSGSSVMAYAGICGADDLQPHTDPYFSQRTISEVARQATADLGGVVEVQTVSLTGFDTDGESISLGYGDAAPVTLTRGEDYDAAGIEAAVEQLTAVDVTVAGWGYDANDSFETFPAPLTEPDDTGFTVIFAGDPDPATEASDRLDMASLTVTGGSAGVSGVVGETAQGGPNGNGGHEVATTDNHAPVVTAPATRTIPIRTPFTLSGSATDADGDPLTYLWEQNDTGGAGGTMLTSNNRRTGPLFRIFGRYADVTPEGTLESPSPGQNHATGTGSTRTFPDLRQVLSGHTNARTGRCPAVPRTRERPLKDLRVLNCYSEFLPVKGYVGTAGSDRPAMHFRLTARDGAPGGGGVGHADVTVRIDPKAGPFLVDSFGKRGRRVAGGSERVIRWQVNNTRKLAPYVEILLSLDNGRTWNHVLARKAKNDGAKRVLIPAVATDRARIMVRALDNYFFDVNDRAFVVR